MTYLFAWTHKGFSGMKEIAEEASNIVDIIRGNRGLLFLGFVTGSLNDRWLAFWVAGGPA